MTINMYVIQHINTYILCSVNKMNYKSYKLYSRAAMRSFTKKIYIYEYIYTYKRIC